MPPPLPLQVKDAIVAFQVQALEIQGAWKSVGEGLSISGSLEPSKIQEMAQLVVANLPHPKSPSMATLSMQVGKRPRLHPPPRAAAAALERGPLAELYPPLPLQCIVT